MLHRFDTPTSPPGARRAERDGPPHIWLLQDGEPLPTDDSPRLMRTGNLAERLIAAGFTVTWWTSRFNHGLKKYRQVAGRFADMAPGYRICYLDGPPYQRNLSWQRMRHYRSLAADFRRLAPTVARPDVVLGSYPSPELSFAGMQFARAHGVTFVVDIRDPWPDIFPAYLPASLSWALAPVMAYYRRKARAIFRSADGILAVSQAMLRWGIEYSGRTPHERDAVFFIGYNKPAAERGIVVPARFTEAEPLICLFATTCGKSYDGVTLIEAARLLEASGERRVRFILSGDGECRAAWMARATGLQTVRFTGWITHEELQHHFQTAHVGLILMHGGITSFWLGNKFGEYLSTSLALINNVSGEAADIVSGHGVGINVPPKDPGALAAALRTLVDAPAEVRDAMTNAKTLFNHTFERGTIYDRYVAYLSACAQGPAAASL